MIKIVPVRLKKFDEKLRIHIIKPKMPINKENYIFAVFKCFRKQRVYLCRIRERK